MKYKFILAFLLLQAFIATGQNSIRTEEPDFSKMIQPVPIHAKFADDDYFIWGGSLVKDEDNIYHLFYSRWEKKLGFQSWVSHSEIAHATATTPFGPFTHQDVVFPVRDSSFWDGKSTHNPTVHKFGSKYYLYYTGNTGDGRMTENLNFSHRNNQRIGVAVANHPNGPWQRFDTPLIDVSPGNEAYDALMVSNPAVTQKPDGTFLLVYKAVGKARAMPFGGPVVHLTATSSSPTGPFIKQMNPTLLVEGSDFPAEDPYIWFQGGKYYAIVKDMKGYFTGIGRSLALFESDDGFSWDKADYNIVTGLSILWENGEKEAMSYLERPQLFFENGKPVVLLLAGNKEENGIIIESFNMQVPLKQSMK